MKVAWLILLVSAFTDLVINSGTALMAAMVATGSAQLPTKGVVLLAVIGGIVAGSRTIQQALKATPETSAALKGDASVVSTSTIARTP